MLYIYIYVYYSIKSSELFLRSVYRLVISLYFNTLTILIENGVRALIQINSSVRKL